MQYKDQLVLTGEINNVGEAVMVNVPQSYRLGVELSGGFRLIPEMLDFSFTATVSRNKIKNFTQYIDQYDEDWNFTGQQANDLGTTNLSFSPSLLGTGSLIFRPLKDLRLSWNSKYVGEQFIDNTSNENRKLNDYLIHGITADYTVRTKVIREIGFQINVSNLFSRKYETNAWVYPWLVGTNYYEVNGYFPQALINFLAGITLKI
jgi:iron complex outermembrane receptor protein